MNTFTRFVAIAALACIGQLLHANARAVDTVSTRFKGSSAAFQGKQKTVD